MWAPHTNASLMVCFALQTVCFSISGMLRTSVFKVSVWWESKTWLIQPNPFENDIQIVNIKPLISPSKAPFPMLKAHQLTKGYTHPDIMAGLVFIIAATQHRIIVEKKVLTRTCFWSLRNKSRMLLAVSLSLNSTFCSWPDNNGAAVHLNFKWWVPVRVTTEANVSCFQWMSV